MWDFKPRYLPAAVWRSSLQACRWRTRGETAGRLRRQAGFFGNRQAGVRGQVARRREKPIHLLRRKRGFSETPQLDGRISLGAVFFGAFRFRTARFPHLPVRPSPIARARRLSRFPRPTSRLLLSTSRFPLSPSEAPECEVGSRKREMGRGDSEVRREEILGIARQSASDWARRRSRERLRERCGREVLRPTEPSPPRRPRTSQESRWRSCPDCQSGSGRGNWS